MSNQDWTSKLQDQLAGYQESVSHDLWAGIEQSLAQKNIESVSTNPQTIASENSESTDLHVGTEVQKNARVLHDSVFAISCTERLSKRESSITRLCVCGNLSSC